VRRKRQIVDCRRQNCWLPAHFDGAEKYKRIESVSKISGVGNAANLKVGGWIYKELTFKSRVPPLNGKLLYAHHHFSQVDNFAHGTS